MRVVQEAIADGIGQGRLPEVVMPLGRRELTGDDRGARAVAILEDLEEIAPGFARAMLALMSARMTTGNSSPLALCTVMIRTPSLPPSTMGASGASPSASSRS